MTGVSTTPEPSPGLESPEAKTSALGRADRLQPFLLVGSIFTGLGAAKVVPGFAESLAPLVSVGVVILIYLVMLSVDARRVTQAFTQRRFLIIAVTINFVVNPLLAWGLAEIFLSAHPDLRVGLILFLVTPCIGWYLIFTELAGGDTGLGVSLLGINLVLQVLLLPAYLHIFAGQATTIDLHDLIVSVVLFLVLPAAAATATRSVLHQDTLQTAEQTIARVHLKTLALVTIIVAMFASQADAIFDDPDIVLTLLVPMVSFFAIAFGLALIVSHLARLPRDQRALLVFTTTSRNSEASLAIAATAFASPLVALTVVIGPVIELPLLVLMVRLLLGRQPHSIDKTQRSPSTPSA